MALASDWTERYERWLEENRPLLEAAKWKEAFEGYPWVKNSGSSFASLGKPLGECTLALVSSAGLYLPGQQRFTDEAVTGDSTFREIPRGTDLSAAGIAHSHYDHRYALEDRNCVYPLDVLEDLVAEGSIGDLTDTHYSFSGYNTDATATAEVSAPEVARRIEAQGADAVLLVPI
jgi:D-proline reductase (dithiol) PrdB